MKNLRTSSGGIDSKTMNFANRFDIIVVLGSTVTALGVVREVANSGKKIIVVDTENGIAMKSRYPHVIVVQEKGDAAVMEVLVSIPGEQVTALLADSDKWLRFILRNYLALRKEFDEILHPDEFSLAICLHKARFLQWCHEHNLPAPVFYSQDTLGALALTESVVRYPVMIRPQETHHGVKNGVPKAVEAHDARELDQWLVAFRQLKVRPVVCESAVSPKVRQYSVGAARRRDGKMRLFVAEKLRPKAERCHGGCYVVQSENKKIQELAEKVLEQLNYYGIAEVEILWNEDNDKYWIIEVNARPWIQMPLTTRSGSNLLAFALGEDSTIERVSTSCRNAKWIWFWADLMECFSRSTGLVTTGRIRWNEYLRSIWSANVFAFWDLRDPWPFLLETIRTVRMEYGRQVRCFLPKRWKA